MVMNIKRKIGVLSDSTWNYLLKNGFTTDEILKLEKMIETKNDSIIDADAKGNIKDAGYGDIFNFIPYQTASKATFSGLKGLLSNNRGKAAKTIKRILDVSKENIKATLRSKGDFDNIVSAFKAGRLIGEHIISLGDLDKSLSFKPDKTAVDVKYSDPLFPAIRSTSKGKIAEEILKKRGLGFNRSDYLKIFGKNLQSLGKADNAGKTVLDTLRKTVSKIAEFGSKSIDIPGLPLKMVGDSFISNFATGGYGMVQNLIKGAKIPGLGLPWGRGGRMGIFESVLGILGGKDKLLGRLFGKGGLFEKVPNLDQIKKLNFAASS